MSSKQWEVLDRSKVNNFANRPFIYVAYRSATAHL
nr:MAG TPA: antitrypsin [Caudoviricetes sp.]